MKRLAIIGTGVAGMATGYFLREHFDVTFFEKNHYAGGHTHTVTVDEDGNEIPVDTGFIVYNEITYPNLTKLFAELDVATKRSDMSFSVRHVPTGLEYCGTGLSGLFAQRRNFFSRKHWKLLLEMNRFNREAPEALKEDRYHNYTVLQYAREKDFSDDFLEKFLVPISSAVWSTPPEQMLHFPIRTLVSFFKNHGFLGLRGHYQWRTVEGGSWQYRDRILSAVGGDVKLNCRAEIVRRENGKVKVTDEDGKIHSFDAVVIAAHADEARKMLENPEEIERNLLSKFRYQKNKATLHTDASVMPKTRRAWSSWNYRIEKHDEKRMIPTTIYYMNKLQDVSKQKDYFVSINDPGLIEEDKILWEAVYEHPLFDYEAIVAQDYLVSLNRRGPVYFCGSYFKYGFHEDALNSALDVARTIAGEDVWK